MEPTNTVRERTASSPTPIHQSATFSINASMANMLRTSAREDFTSTSTRELACGQPPPTERAARRPRRSLKTDSHALPIRTRTTQTAKSLPTPTSLIQKIVRSSTCALMALNHVSWVAVLEKFSMTTSRDATTQTMCPDGKWTKNQNILKFNGFNFSNYSEDWFRDADKN